MENTETKTFLDIETMSNLITTLTVIEEYRVETEAYCSKIVEKAQQQFGFDLIDYSVKKVVKKDEEYFKVKLKKKFADEKLTVAE